MLYCLPYSNTHQFLIFQEPEQTLQKHEYIFYGYLVTRVVFYLLKYWIITLDKYICYSHFYIYTLHISSKLMFISIYEVIKQIIILWYVTVCKYTDKDTFSFRVNKTHTWPMGTNYYLKFWQTIPMIKCQF